MPNTLNAFVTGLNKFHAQLKRPGRVLVDAAEYMLNNFPPSPPTHRDSGDENKWDSPRQIRWYYWQVESGQLENPYRRTQRLEQSLRLSQLENIDNGQQIIIFSDHPKAVFIIGDASVLAEQAAVHEGRWWQFDLVAEGLEANTLNQLELDLNTLIDQLW